MSFPVAKPTTAPVATTSSVHEFICLYTHDLKRKTKRWQDGRLKYHAFNGRIMVYDDRGGVVGDSHLSSSQTLDEGEEMTLDRGAAIVQVCERVGEKQVDLGNLVDKRAREVEKRRREALEKQQKQQRARPQVPSSSGGVRPLSAIMNTPGRIGRAAIPKESPYEQRLMRESGNQHGDTPTPPAKRRKTSPSPPTKMTHARSLFGTPLTLSAQPVSSWRARSQVLKDRTNVRVQSSPADEKTGDEDVQIMEVQKAVRKQRTEPRVARQSSPPEESSDTPQEEDYMESRPAIRDEARPLNRIGASHLGSLRTSRESQPTTTSRAQTTASRENDRERDTDVVTIDSSAEEVSTSISVKKLRDNSALQSIKQSVLRRVADEASRPAADLQKPKDDSDETIRPQRSASPRRIPVDGDEDIKEVLPRKKKTISRKTRIDGDREASDDKRSEERNTLHQKPVEKDEESRGASKPRKKPASRKQTTNSSNSGDLSNAQKANRAAKPRKELMPEEPIEKSPPEEARPRTELRIKSRKRRGLLMLSERNSPAIEQKKPSPEPTKAASPPSMEEDAEDFEAWYAQGALDDDPDGPAEQDQPEDAPVAMEVDDDEVRQRIPTDLGVSNPTTLLRKLSPPPELIQNPANPAEEDAEDGQTAQAEEPPTPKQPHPPEEDNTISDDADSDGPQPLKTRARKPPPCTIPQFESDGPESDDDWTGPPPPTANSRQAKEKLSAKPKAAEKNQAKVVPHMKRISRSTKSKEIFGFQVPGSEHLIPDAFATATGRVGWRQPSEVDLGTVETRPPFPSGQEVFPEISIVKDRPREDSAKVENEQNNMDTNEEIAEGKGVASLAVEPSACGNDSAKDTIKSLDSEPSPMVIDDQTLGDDDASTASLSSASRDAQKTPTKPAESDTTPMAVDNDEPATETAPNPITEVDDEPEPQVAKIVASEKTPAAQFLAVEVPSKTQPEVDQGIKNAIKDGNDAAAEVHAHEEPNLQSTTITQESASTSFTSDSGKPPVKRIVNPATRGRKAASKADAAGRPPSSQALVPYDEVQAPQRRLVVKPAALQPKGTAVRRQASAPSALPGFSAASGGAWSRHAEDLLGMGRPQAAK